MNPLLGHQLYTFLTFFFFFEFVFFSFWNGYLSIYKIYSLLVELLVQRRTTSNQLLPESIIQQMM